MPEMAETMSQITGREISYYQVPWNQSREQIGEEITVMYEWFNEVGYEADTSAYEASTPSLLLSNSISATTAGRRPNLP